MLIAALSHLYAFPYKEYAGAKYWRFSWFPWKPCPCDKIEWLLPWHGSPGESCIMCQFLTENYCFGHESCADDDGDCRVLFLQFAPTYHDYVLYNHNEGDEGRRKFRSRTFVPTDPEMDAVRKNKHMLGNKLDDIQLSSVSSSGTSNPKQSSTAQDSQNPETIKSSLLPSNSYNVPYDMSLIDIDLSSYPSKVPAANAGSFSLNCPGD